MPERVRAASKQDLIESLSSLLALSIDNARWFGRLRTLGAEAERARIARELHDRVAQSLAYVAFELERMHGLPGEKVGEIAELRVVVRDIVRELRETIYQLRANVSEVEDIVMVAGGYLERFAERTGIATQWLPSASAPLPYRIEQELWRIGQEALVNVERHADATAVIVRWEVHDGVARLEVADNGSGFEPAAVAGEHYGLVGMRERADAIGAQLAIESQPGRGTKVAVELALTGPAGIRAEIGLSIEAPERRRVRPDAGPARRRPPAPAPGDPPGARRRRACRWSPRPADGGEAVRLAGELRPDVVVMDVSMPVLDGVEATRRVHAELPDLPIVILTMHGDDALRRDAVAAGATGLPHQGRLDAGGRRRPSPRPPAATSRSRPSWRPRSWPSSRTAPTGRRRR